MTRKAVITLMLACLAMMAKAQNFLDHLQDKQAKGTVTVTQSKAIDDLVNGKNTTPTTTTTKIRKASVAEKKHVEQAKTEHQAARQHKPDSTKETARRDEPAKKQVESSDNDMEIPTIDMRKKVMRNSRKVTGYRVQAFAGGNSRADRAKAQRIGNNIKMNYPDQPIYVHFYSPRWICRVGNFRSYNEAADMLRKVKKLGYKSAVIVRGKITVQY